ncbi:MAG TPA: hypothetical protein VIG74_00140 [Alphaproteobacteria bacterium]
MDHLNKTGDDIAAKWQRYLLSSTFSALVLAECAVGRRAYDRQDIASCVKGLRDLRRDFMAACGEQDDAYLAPEEAALIRYVEALSAKAVAACGLEEWEIKAAVPPFL